MLRSIKDLVNYRLHARDGDLGGVEDFYFDDRSWIIRYLVANAESWLAKRLVLVSPTAITSAEWSDRRIHVDLTKEQVRKSPPVTRDEPVSRQKEEELTRYYDWPMYWAPLGVGAPAAVPAAGVQAAALRNQPNERQGVTMAGSGGAEKRGDPNLRSVDTVTGYYIAAEDGDIGHVEDFIVDDEVWAIRYLVVDTRNWLPGRKVLTAPDWIQEIRWEDSRVGVNLTREQVKQSPAYDPAVPINRDYEARLYDFYGRPRYWS